MKAIIIYDNTRYHKALQADWGFSCMVYGGGIPTILFNTGANGQILLSNMRKLDITPKMIDVVFISYAHFGHTRGLRTFRTEIQRRKYILHRHCMATAIKF
jgi:7,8-dihydropterin-6-yl-methyl-4-(beta-D-ribofuranosyl)aminobenzene 5'-phosphate synthase